MRIIRVNFLPEFDYGNDAVLLTMDGAGVDTFRTHHRNGNGAQVDGTDRQTRS